jgi:hypothetical protein
MPTKRTTTKRKPAGTTTTTKTTKATAKADPLAAYLQLTQAGALFHGSLTQGGHTTEIVGKSEAQVEQRAREILASRGVTV